MRMKWAIIAAVLLGWGSQACVPKKRLEAKEAEASACYKALRKENARKKELSEALGELQTRLESLANERERLATEKGSLEGNLANLEAAVQEQISQIQSLSTEKERLAQEKSKLEAEREALVKKSATYDELVSSLKQEMTDKLVEVKRQGQRITVNLSDQILFDSGSTIIKASGQTALQKIATVLNKVQNRRIDVEGHTDSVPITGALAKTFPSNWELSAARATNVVRFLQEQGVDPSQMAAVGKSQYRPVSSNTSPSGRRLNRRIEIVLSPWDSSGGDDA